MNMCLSEHTITKIEQYNVRTRFPRFHGKNANLPAHYYGLSDVGILVITTDKGATGFGRGRRERSMVAALLGQKLSDVFDPAVGILNPILYHADLALHDLAGKILGIPVKKMLSENCGATADCYDGSIYMNDLCPDNAPGGIKAIIDNCYYDRDVLGFKDFKIKIGRGKTWMEYEEGLQRDIDVVREVRKHFPDSKIMVDANDAYTLDTTIRFMEGVKDCGIHWIEEPFRDENIDDFRKLKEYLVKNSPETLIADGEWAPEYIHTKATVGIVEQLAKEKLLDIALMDTFEFGFTNWRTYLKRIEELGIKASPHNWNLTLKTIYCSHLAAAFPNLIAPIEGVGDTTEGIDHSKYTMKDGLLTVPDAPGFGMEFLWGHHIQEEI